MLTSKRIDPTETRSDRNSEGEKTTKRSDNKIGELQLEFPTLNLQQFTQMLWILKASLSPGKYVKPAKRFRIPYTMPFNFIL